MAECPAARDLFANQDDLTPPYVVYGREDQRGAAEKAPPIGRFDAFQTGPGVYEKCICDISTNHLFTKKIFRYISWTAFAAYIFAGCQLRTINYKGRLAT